MKTDGKRLGMEKSSKRGKIPQTDWPQIMARYEAGETLASIARTYDCSAPAISYIVSRSREKPATESLPPPPTEPQLIKAQPSEAAALAVEPSVAVAPAAAELRRESAPEPREPRERAEANLFPRNGSADRPAIPMATAAPRPMAATNGDSRPKLHLSLGNGSGNGHGSSNGNGHLAEGHANGERPGYPPTPRPPQYQDAAERIAPKPFQPAPRGPFDQGRNGRDLFAAPEGRPQAQMPRDDGDSARRGNPGAFIDQELRTRVDGDIAVFLAAFDAALASDTQESRFGLREATDRLLRAGARTRIELERLEARVPLTPRDSGVQADPGAWRHR
jgi:transposase-like protein